MIQGLSPTFQLLDLPWSIPTPLLPCQYGHKAEEKVQSRSQSLSWQSPQFVAGTLALLPVPSRFPGWKASPKQGYILDVTVTMTSRGETTLAAHRSVRRDTVQIWPWLQPEYPHEQLISYPKKRKEPRLAHRLYHSPKPGQTWSNVLLDITRSRRETGWTTAKATSKHPY